MTKSRSGLVLVRRSKRCSSKRSMLYSRLTAKSYATLLVASPTPSSCWFVCLRYNQHTASFRVHTCRHRPSARRLYKRRSRNCLLIFFLTCHLWHQSNRKNITWRHQTCLGSTSKSSNISYNNNSEKNKHRKKNKQHKKKSQLMQLNNQICLKMSRIKMSVTQKCPWFVDT